MKHHFYLFLFIIALTACEDKKQDMLSQFPHISIAAIQEKEIETDSIRNPYIMECVEGKLFFANMNQPKMISQFDVTSGKFLNDFLDRGEGPKELLFISSLTECNKQLAVFDSEKRQLFFYSTSNEEPLKESEITLLNDSLVLISMFNCIPLDKEHFAATGLVRDNRIALLNHTGKAIKGFGDYPGNKKDADTENGFAYQSFMAYNPTEKILAIGSCFGESISFYNMNDLTSPFLIKEHTYAYPAYKDVTNERSQGVAFKQENIMGFIAIKPSPKYCIGLYSGKERSGIEYGGDKILLFDWTGKAAKALQLDQTYQQMAYNKQNDEIILLGTDKESGDYRIVAIQLCAL